MKQQVETKNENLQPLTRGRRAALLFLDLLITVGIGTLLSVTALSVASFIPATQEIVERLDASRKDVIDVISASHLNGEDAASLADVSEAYVKSIAKTSLLHHGSPVSVYYQDIKPLDQDSDPLCYYYVTYKPAHEAEYLDYGAHGIDAYFEKLDSRLPETFIKDDNGFPVFDAYTTKMVDEGLRDSTYEPGILRLNEIFNGYLDLLREGCMDLEKNNSTYLAKYETFQAAYRDYGFLAALISVMAGCLATLITYVMIPLFNKSGRTISGMAYRAKYIRKDGESPEKWRLVLKGLLSLAYGPLVGALSLVLTSGTAGLEVLNISSGGVSFLLIAVISLCIGLAFYLTSFFGPKQEAPDAIFGVKLMDGREEQ